MKRVIAMVISVQDDGPSDLVGRNGELDLQGVGSESGGHVLEQGETRIEVVVSDEQASRILKAVLGDELAEKVKKPAPDLEAAIEKEVRESDPGEDRMLERIVSRVERQLITDVYHRCDRVKSRAATRLGINRNTLLKKLRQFGEIDESELKMDLGVDA